MLIIAHVKCTVGYPSWLSKVYSPIIYKKKDCNKKCKQTKCHDDGKDNRTLKAWSQLRSNFARGAGDQKEFHHKRTKYLKQNYHIGWIQP